MNASIVRRDFRHTKIICTLGPASQEYGTIRDLATAGMNVARLNMSHGSHASHAEAIHKIKALNRRLNHPLAVLLDLQGPEIRTGDVSSSIELRPGELLALNVRGTADAALKTIHVNYDLVDDVQVGDRVTVDNGLINLEVLERRELGLYCRVLDGGTLGSRRHVNLPGVHVNLPSVTPKDRDDIAFGIKHQVDFIAPSFVRAAADVLEVRRILDEHQCRARIIAKIENREGVDNFDAILEAADGIM